MSLIVLLVLYFLPSIIASVKMTRNSRAIFFFNLLLGWTVIGWIVAMVYAVRYDAPVSQVKTAATLTEPVRTR